VFDTTAARDQELEEIFTIFPTFLRESRETLARLERFATESDPVVQALMPAARELQPTLVEVERLAPELNSLFVALRGAIDAAPDGFAATRDLLDRDLPPLLEGFDPWLADFNSILDVVGKYRREVTSALANVAAATQGVFFDPTLGKSFHYLRTLAPLGPEALSTYPQRLQISRTNPYFKPGAYLDLLQGLQSFETRQCTSGLTAFLDPATPTDPAFNERTAGDVAAAQAFFDRLQQYAFDGALTTASITPPGCTQQAPYTSVGVSPEQSNYLHVREQP
jgi:ABC-type transporter Mla subunit MlaD